MSDPVAKDVEDVLSSIRRLVSDTSPDAKPSVSQNTNPKTNMRDALILTSALRVDGADDAAPDGATPDEFASGDSDPLTEGLDHLEDEALDEGHGAEERARTEDDQQSDSALDDGPDASAHDPDARTARSDLGSLRQAVSGAFMGEPVMPAVLHKTQNVKKAADVSSALESKKGWGSRPPEDYYEDEEVAAANLSGWEYDPDAHATQSSVNEVLDRRDPEAPAGDADQPEDSPADVQAFREDAPEDMPEDREDRTDEGEPDAADQSLAEDEMHQQDVPEDVASQQAASTTDTQVTPYADDISDEYEWDEDDEEVEDPVNIATFRHTPIDAILRAEAAAPASHATVPVTEAVAIAEEDVAADDAADDDAEVSAGSEQAANGKQIDLSDLDEAVLDEETLRELVSDIVRRELAGELGERITRNVRKLVRREIHRALLTREFD